MSERALAPGNTIGILGGGQLGRMLAAAAARLGFATAVLAPERLAPAFQLAGRCFEAAYDDESALSAFAEAVDVVTLEFENVPAATVEYLAANVPVRPAGNALATTQDRLLEKDFLAVLDIPVPSYRTADNAEELSAATDAVGPPALAKTRRFGYDGKGQARLETPEDAAEAWKTLGAAPALVEQMVPFDKEISILIARTPEGKMKTYPPVENDHAGGILRSSRVPANVSDAVAETALGYAQSVAEALDYVGVLAVEMFVIDESETVLVNEIAPRVHNSGHWTIEGAVTSQFEQHIRAVAGLPLGASEAIGQAEMQNLLGSDIARWGELLTDPKAHVHHYGKVGARPGRKMGHVTWVTPPRSR